MLKYAPLQVELDGDLYGDEYGELPPTLDPLTNVLTMSSPPISPTTEPFSVDMIPVTSSSSSSLRTSSLHLYDNQLPELQDHYYYNLTRRSHSISTGQFAGYSRVPLQNSGFRFSCDLVVV